MTTRSDDAPSLSRRDFFKHAGAASLTAALSPLPTLATDAPAPADGTPEQIHLTFGDDPTSTVIVSWASAAQAHNPRVILHHPPATPPRSTPCSAATPTGSTAKPSSLIMPD